MSLSIRAQWWIVGAATVVLTLVAACTAPPRAAGVYAAPRPSPGDQDGALVETKERPEEGGQDLYIPERPEAWQKQKGCDPDMDEHLLAGACYQRTGRKPPCGPKLRRHGESCYRFVAKPPREPSSINR